MATLDLKKAFWRIGLSRQSQRLVGFKIGEQYFTFKVMPFGLSWAPYVFTETIRPVIQRIKDVYQELNIHAYLDDILITGEQSQVAEAIRKLGYQLEMNGFPVNKEKSVLQPRQSVKYLGLHIHARDGFYTIPIQKARKLRRRLRRFRYGGTLRRLQAVISSTRFYSIANPILAPLIRRAQIWIARAVQMNSWEKIMKPPKKIVAELQIAADQLQTTTYLFSRGPTDAILTTDATPSKLGATLFTKQENTLTFFQGQFFGRASITHKEMAALVLALRTFKIKPGSLIHIMGDNLGGIFALQRGTAKDLALAKILYHFWRVIQEKQLRIIISHRRSEQNTLADWLSRGTLLLNPTTTSYSDLLQTQQEGYMNDRYVTCGHSQEMEDFRIPNLGWNLSAAIQIKIQQQ